MTKNHPVNVSLFSIGSDIDDIEAQFERVRNSLFFFNEILDEAACFEYIPPHFHSRRRGGFCCPAIAQNHQSIDSCSYSWYTPIRELDACGKATKVIRCTYRLKFIFILYIYGSIYREIIQHRFNVNL